MRINNNQGLATVELVLILPILLLFILLLLHITKAMMTNIDVINESRITAWRDAIGIISFDGLRSCSQIDVDLGQDSQGINNMNPFLPTAKSGEKICTKKKFESLSNNDLISSMRTAGKKEYSDIQGLTSTINAQNNIAVFTSSAKYYSSHAWLSLDLNVKKNYALVANAIWTTEDVPLGYDYYLKDKLDSKCLFTRMFPKAGAIRTPDCKLWGFDDPFEDKDGL